MNTLLVVLIIIATLLSVGVIGVIGFYARKTIKKAKFDRKMKELKNMINEMRDGELYIVDFGSNITIELEDLEIVNVGIGANDYASVQEALIHESVGGYRRRQLFSLQKDMEAAYRLWNVQTESTKEVRQEEQVYKQEQRKEKFYTMIDTGDMDGQVYVYQPTQFVLGDHLKAEISKDKFGYMSIDTVWYAPEGNVTSPKAIYPFDVRTEKGSKSYAHYVENSGKFDEEAVKMLDIISRLDKYNVLVEEGRIKVENGIYQIEPPALKEAKEQVDQQFEEPTIADVEQLV